MLTDGRTHGRKEGPKKHKPLNLLLAAAVKTVIMSVRAEITDRRREMCGTGVKTVARWRLQRQRWNKVVRQTVPHSRHNLSDGHLAADSWKLV